MTTRELPFVSIIMPIRNEADFVARSLGAVVAQDYPHDRLEVLVADGMSDDGTRLLVRQIAADADFPITLIDNPRRIVPTGFNAALIQAKGEIIVRIDGHCEIAADYVTQCVEHLASGVSVGVGGPIETISLTAAGETIALAMSSPFGVGNSSFRTVKDRALFVDTIAFPAYTRAALDAAGPLDEELVRNQDDEYNYRLRSLGYRLLLTPDIRSRYFSRNSLRKLWWQYFQYGVYKVRVMQKHPWQMRPRQFAPLILVSTILLGGVLSPLSGAIRRPWIVALLAYSGLNFLASLQIAGRSGWRHLGRLPLVFAILHLSYGLGFLNGLWKFRNRWRSA